MEGPLRPGGGRRLFGVPGSSGRRGPLRPGGGEWRGCAGKRGGRAVGVAQGRAAGAWGPARKPPVPLPRVPQRATLQPLAPRPSVRQAPAIWRNAEKGGDSLGFPKLSGRRTVLQPGGWGYGREGRWGLGVPGFRGRQALRRAGARAAGWAQAVHFPSRIRNREFLAIVHAKTGFISEMPSCWRFSKLICNVLPRTRHLGYECYVYA